MPDLLEWEKKFSTQVKKIRYMIEQVIANFKTWRIMHTDYRRPLDTFETTISAVVGLHSSNGSAMLGLGIGTALIIIFTAPAILLLVTIGITIISMLALTHLRHVESRHGNHQTHQGVKMNLQLFRLRYSIRVDSYSCHESLCRTLVSIRKHYYRRKESSAFILSQNNGVTYLLTHSPTGFSKFHQTK
jgi:hypothetical protein